MEDISTLFHGTEFIDPQDPYKLALVASGQKDGHLVYDIGPDETVQLGGASQGAGALTDILLKLETPFFTREVTQPVGDTYGSGEITLIGFFVGATQDWVQKYDEKLEDASDCRTLGEFEGYPECCVTEFCTATPDYLEQDGDYLDAVTAYLTEHEVAETDARLLTILPDLSHYPCSFDCERSLTMSEDYLTFFDDHYQEAFSYFEELSTERLADRGLGNKGG
ncbi:DUF483 domain-containing protein [Natrinema sp. 1APR25-10V2]|uniref:DUF483 domain-containing protein n=1 Tax=Natrinema sp. 1APR25-10V2 TaxID=2951081 RepID=UPI00287687B9|nr:DUF483 domain-containing protein [Natrinema sp. 1APR25-10V2]MDS0476846.1 DUF483 domain-containing protein [Natrinema sp. 1APR25-10V2]